MTLRPTIIRNARLLDADRWRGERADILIVGDSIEAIGVHLPGPEEAMEWDAESRLIHPGLVNAHTHRHAALAKGTGDRWTLELLLAAGPWLSGQRSHEDRYVTAALNAAELALKGCTTAYDLTLELPVTTGEGTMQAVQAYLDVGVRVVMAPMLSNRSLYDAVPGLREILPPELQQSLPRSSSWQTTLHTIETLHQGWTADNDLARLAIAPTIPAHCSDDFLVACKELAETTGMVVQSHVAESKVQLIAGEERYHASIIAHLAKLGLLRPGFTAAHGVWLDDDDMARIANAGSSVAVNPGSNMRLGNGLPDVHRMIDHGINIAVGTDGSNSSDNQNMYEAIRLTSFVSRLQSPEPANWITAQQALRAATLGGAAALGFHDRIGRLAPGAKADLVFLDTRCINWLPVNNPGNQLVYTEDGSSVRDVMVGGRFTVRDRQLLTIDLDALGKRAQLARERLDRQTLDARNLFDRLQPYIASYCPGLAARPHRLHRYCGHGNKLTALF